MNIESQCLHHGLLGFRRLVGVQREGVGHAYIRRPSQHVISAVSNSESQYEVPKVPLTRRSISSGVTFPFRLQLCSS